MNEHKLRPNWTPEQFAEPWTHPMYNHGQSPHPCECDFCVRSRAAFRALLTTPGPWTYEQVMFRDGEKVRQVFLRITNCKGAWVRGYEVNQECEEIAPVGADRRLRIIHKSAVISRRVCAVNLHYGTLEPGKVRL